MFLTDADILRDSTGVTTIAIPSATTVFTKAHKIGAGNAFGLSVLLSSTTTPAVKVELQVSDTAPVALEGVVDTVGADWCIQEGGSPIFTSVVDKVLHKITITPTPCKYIRLKLTGLSSPANPSDTTGVFKIISQQQLGV